MAGSGEEEKEADLGTSPALLLGEQPGLSPATPHLPPAEPFLDRREEGSPQSSVARAVFANVCIAFEQNRFPCSSLGWCEDTNAPLKNWRCSEDGLKPGETLLAYQTMTPNSLQVRASPPGLAGEAEGWGCSPVRRALQQRFACCGDSSALLRVLLQEDAEQ